MKLHRVRMHSRIAETTITEFAEIMVPEPTYRKNPEIYHQKMKQECRNIYVKSNEICWQLVPEPSRNDFWGAGGTNYLHQYYVSSWYYHIFLYLKCNINFTGSVGRQF